MREQRVEKCGIDLFQIQFEPVVVNVVGRVGAVPALLLTHLIAIRLCVKISSIAYGLPYWRRARGVFLCRWCPQKDFQLVWSKLGILFWKTFVFVKLVQILSFTRVDNGIEVFPESGKE